VKQQVYLSTEEALKILTPAENMAAIELLGERPAVIPFTRVILNREEATLWFGKVTDRMKELGIGTDSEKVRAFCDIAGVPD
jgi:hypothetical protein